MGLAALGGAIMAVMGIRHIQRRLDRDEKTRLPVSFLSVSQLYGVVDLGDRRDEALDELTQRLGYRPKY